jgi:hypothetical protein
MLFCVLFVFGLFLCFVLKSFPIFSGLSVSAYHKGLKDGGPLQLLRPGAVDFTPVADVYSKETFVQVRGFVCVFIIHCLFVLLFVLTLVSPSVPLDAKGVIVAPV